MKNQMDSNQPIERSGYPWQTALQTVSLGIGGMALACSIGLRAPVGILLSVLAFLAALPPWLYWERQRVRLGTGFHKNRRARDWPRTGMEKARHRMVQTVFTALSLACSVASVVYLIVCSDPFGFFGRSESAGVWLPASSDVSGSEDTVGVSEERQRQTAASGVRVLPESLPAFSEQPYVEVNGNIPAFSESDYATSSYVYYSDMDALGRCGVCVACVGQDILPSENPKFNTKVFPTGWQNTKYDFLDGQNLYERCRLMGYPVTASVGGRKNMIAGTQYLVSSGVQPFLDRIAAYVRDTGHHVLYRATPVFIGDNMLASGVQLEAFSIEDHGAGLRFHVYCYNVQPGVVLDYRTGESTREADDEPAVSETAVAESDPDTVWIPQNGGTKYHARPNCSGMKDPVSVERETAIAQGFEPCKRCY